MKKFKVSMVVLIALVCGISLTAFTGRHTVKQPAATGFFYEYTSASTAQADIQNINNYERSTSSCGGGAHVCGVFLPTDKALGQAPVPSEFNAQKVDLWDSEQNGQSTNPGVIEMRN